MHPGRTAHLPAVMRASTKVSLLWGAVAVFSVGMMQATTSNVAGNRCSACMTRCM